MQSVIEETIAKVTQEQVSVVGSGRTDAGAHALAQVVAFSSNTALSAHVLRRALNATLPPDIAVTAVRDVAASFHPRFDAHSRTYRYLIFNRRAPSPFWHLRSAHVKHTLDVSAMARAGSYLVGTHDFASFVPTAHASNSVRTFYEATCRRDDDVIAVELRASGFKQQMVRSIVGTLVRVGESKVDPEQFAEILRSRDHRRAGDTMPACGLYLAAVQYPAGTFDDQVSFSVSPGAAQYIHGHEEKA